MQTFLITIILIFLLLRLLVATYNFFSSPILTPLSCSTSALISVLIPARNEALNLPVLLKSILAQNLAQMEILILDDHSSDGTREIAESFAMEHRKIRVLRGKPLAEGWTGKNFACHQLACEASGKYLLFLDADVKLHHGAIKNAVRRMKEKRLSLLSLIPSQQTFTFGEKITVPLMNYLLLTLLPLKLIESHPDPVFSAACGQFMLFRASSYQKHEWHKQARGKITEDLEIMKLIKQSGEKGEGLLSGNLVTCRMYSGFQTAAQGFSKNFIAPFNNNILLYLTFVTLVALGPLLIMTKGNAWQISSMVVLITGIRLVTNKLSGQPLWQIILHPLQLLSLIYISIHSISQRLTNSAQWKGRSIPVNSAPAYSGKL